MGKTNLVRRISSLVIIISLIFQQTGFAQMAAQIDLSGYLSGLKSNFTQDVFRPAHLRYFSYDNLTDNFKLLLEKGSQLTTHDSQLTKEAQELLKYFLTGVSLPDDMFWVNLRPNSQDQVIDNWLAKTNVGKIMLEADLQLKKDTAMFTSPETALGRKYWDKLYKKAAELYGYDNITIPTLTRPWIVPGEIIIRETRDEGRGTTPSAYIYKATLRVMLEEDYLKNNTVGAALVSAQYEFKDPRAKELNRYSTELIRELIIPKLTKEVNSSKRYAALRQVYYSLILSRWFKARFGSQKTEDSRQKTEKKTGYVKLINSKNLTNLTSQETWLKNTYFKQYQKSFTDGEYNIKEPVSTPTGQVIRSYFSGGITVGAKDMVINILPGRGPISSAVLTQPELVYIEGKADKGEILLVTSGKKTFSSGKISTEAVDYQGNSYQKRFHRDVAMLTLPDLSTKQGVMTAISTLNRAQEFFKTASASSVVEDAGERQIISSSLIMDDEDYFKDIPMKNYLDMFRDYDYRYVGLQKLEPKFVFLLGLTWVKMALEKADAVGINNRRVLVARDARKIEPELLISLTEALTCAGLDVIDITVDGPNAVTSYSWAAQEVKPLMSIFLTASHVSRPEEEFVRGFKVAMLNKKGGNLQSMSVREIKVISKDIVAGFIKNQDGIKKMQAVEKGTYSTRNINDNCVRVNTLIGRVAAQDGSLYDLARELEGDDPIAVLGKWEKSFESEEFPLKGIKVVIEGAHTPSGELAARTFGNLGAKVILINGDIHEVDGQHKADPSKDVNLVELKAAMEKENADFGIAFDLDGDRGAILVPVRLHTSLESRFVSLAPDNLIVALLPYLIEKAGYNSEVINKKIGVIRDVLGTFGVNDRAKELEIEAFQTDAGYVFLKALREELVRGQGYIIPIYGERSGHCWLDVTGEIENPLAVAVLFANMVKKGEYVNNKSIRDNPFYTMYSEKSVPYYQSPRFQPAFHPDLLKTLSIDSRNTTGWNFDSKKTPPQAIVALGKDKGILALREEFIKGKIYDTPAGELRVREFNTYKDSVEEGGLYRFADIVFESLEGEFIGRFVFRASSNDPTFVCSYEVPVTKSEAMDISDKKLISVGGVVLNWLENNKYAIITLKNIKDSFNLSIEVAVKKLNDLNLVVVERHLNMYKKYMADKETRSSSSLQSAPKDMGAVDFRAMNIKFEGGFKGINLKLPKLSESQLNNINIDSEIRQIKQMVSSGISPSEARLMEIAAACEQKGKMSVYGDDLLLCIACACGLAEANGEISSRDFITVLARVDSRR